MKSIKLAFLLTCLGLATVARAGTIEMTVNGLVCAFCAQGIEKTFRKDPATADVLVSLEHKLVAIETEAGADISNDALRAALKDAGYDIKEIRRSSRGLAAVRAEIREPGA
jgi:copper chaperone CopZ